MFLQQIIKYYLKPQESFCFSIFLFSAKMYLIIDLLWPCCKQQAAWFPL